MGCWQVTKKDLRLLVRDRRAFAVLIVFPLAFISILGTSADKILDRNRRDETVHADRGQTASAAPHGSTIAPASLESAVRDRGVSAEREGVARSQRKRTHAEEMPGEPALLPGGEPRHAVALVDDPGEQPADVRPLDSRAASAGLSPDEATSSRPGGVYETLVPAYTVMFAFFLVNVMARSFIAERELGTLRRLQIAPVTPAGLLAGKTVPFLLVSLVQSGLLFVIGKVVFGMSWGTMPWLLIPVLVCMSLAATALGLCVATLVRTDAQVSAYANFLVIAMAGVSGCFLPRDWLPEVMQSVSLITPHAWALIACEQILSTPAPSLAVVTQCCAALAGFAVLFFALGCRRFRSMET